MGIGNAAEILESALSVLLHPVAVGIHAAKFPGRTNIAVAAESSSAPLRVDIREKAK
jgi:hypothetical protein